VDKVGQRLLHEETIPAHEKMFSLFEPHTEWIQKGKQRPNVDWGTSSCSPRISSN
jgi:hypothetical protein